MSAMHQPVDDTYTDLISQVRKTNLVALDRAIANCTKSDYPRWEQIGKMQGIRDSITKALYHVKPCVRP